MRFSVSVDFGKPLEGLKESDVPPAWTNIPSPKTRAVEERVNRCSQVNFSKSQFNSEKERISNENNLKEER